MQAAKEVARYLKSTADFCLLMSASSPRPLTLIGMVDADYAACVDTRRSVSGMAFFYGNSLVSWGSSKQSLVTLSSCESEYVSLASGAKEAEWLRGFLQELKFPQE